MGIYYAAPLLGPSLGPILGGALTQQWSWRATFYFLAALCALSLMSFFLFKDTFRRERSLAYQAAARRFLKTQMEEQKKIAAVQPPKGFEHASTDYSEKALEAQDGVVVRSMSTDSQKLQQVKLSLRDINPLGPVPDILRRRSNSLILAASGKPRCRTIQNSTLMVLLGLLFAFSYSILYTCSRTFSNVYHFDSLEIGLVLLSYGVGMYLIKPEFDGTNI